MHQADEGKYVYMSNAEAEDFCVVKADLFTIEPYSGGYSMTILTRAIQIVLEN